MNGLQLRSFVEVNFDVIKTRCTTDEVVFVCPQPGCKDVSGNRAVNLRTGKTNCWRCHIGGDFIHWVKALGYEVDLTSASALDVNVVEELAQVLNSKKPSVPLRADIQFPSGFVKVENHLDSAYAKAIANMAEKKQLTIDDMIKAGVGFTTADPVWAPYAIFPIIEWGRLVLYQGRAICGAGKRFPSRQSCPLGSRYWVYNIDVVRNIKPRAVIVVESILNVLSLQKKICAAGYSNEIVPVAVFKHAVSWPQSMKLIRCPRVEEICLMFDVDATQVAWSQARRLINHKKVTVAQIDPTKSKLLDLRLETDQLRAKKWDPNDDVDCAWEAFLDRRPYTFVEQLDAELQRL